MGKPASILSLPPLWVLLFVASAVLFLGGAAIFWVAGASSKALAGLAGALASVVTIVAFHGKDHPPPGDALRVGATRRDDPSPSQEGSSWRRRSTWS